MQHDPDDPFLSFTDLIYTLRHSTATLASAVDRHGLYHWDRYGRFLKVTAQSEGGKAALDLLAWLYKERFDDQFREEKIDIDMFREWGDDFGWISSDCPDLDTITTDQRSPPPPAKGRSPGEIKSDNAYNGIILGLLKFIRGEFDDIEKHPNYRSDTQLREYLDKKMQAYPGCSARNSLKRFKDANALVPKG